MRNSAAAGVASIASIASIAIRMLDRIIPVARCPRVQADDLSQGEIQALEGLYGLCRLQIRAK
jgi:hypothetical protein